MKKFKLPIIVTAILLLILVAGIYLKCSGDYESLTGLRREIYVLLNKKNITETEFTGKVSGYKWSKELEYKLEDTAVLMKEAEEDFIILNITDLHIADFTSDALATIETFEKIKDMVAETEPDLITVTGDNVWEDSNMNSINRLTEFMDSLEIPWAPIFGNHDDEGNCDLNYLADVMMESPYCLFQKGDPEMGCGNYIINVCQEEGGERKVVHSIIMMDTHHSALWENQIEWYQWAMEGVTTYSADSFESSVFMHIPCAQYQYAYEEAWDHERNSWKEGYEAFGEKNEQECCERDENDEPVDNGFFAAVTQSGSTKNIFCGHDHVNNYSIVYQGVRITYTMKSSLGASYKPGMLGGTKISIGNGGSMTVQHLYY